jgi:hypothetical protein
VNESKNLTSDLDYKQMRALLKTLADDDHAQIKKLEIRRKINGSYRVVVNVKEVENPDENQDNKATQ